MKLCGLHLGAAFLYAACCMLTVCRIFFALHGIDRFCPVPEV